MLGFLIRSVHLRIALVLLGMQLCNEAFGMVFEYVLLQEWYLWFFEASWVEIARFKFYCWSHLLLFMSINWDSSSKFCAGFLGFVGSILTKP